MKIEKTPSVGILVTTDNKPTTQVIYFDTKIERDIVFKYWQTAIDELEKSKAIFRPVYEYKNGDLNILKLRYTTKAEILEVDKAHKEHFPDSDGKLVMIYNELERTYHKVNL